MQAVPNEIAQLQASMTALEAQRPILGDGVVEPALAALREKLAALQAHSAQAEQRRKQATVLFADVSGFTAMSETLDAEVVAGVMNDLWAAVDTAITEQGGYIDKHIGDAVMALWGAETAREDDPERAVRAALAMQAAINTFCTTHRVPLAMRIGLNTGPVLLGAVGTTGEVTAMGDTVNLASRLEHAAPVGGVLIGHDTYRLVRGIFDVLPQEPLAVKGKADPVQTYVVQQAKPRAFRMATRGVEGIETRMIGRDHELGMLQDAFSDMAEASETRVVTIAGEAGVGKSRLLYEFDNWLQLRPETIRYFKGRATPNTQHVSYSLFRNLFTFRFEILDSDSAAVALQKFRAGMAGFLESEQADITGQWLGFDFSASAAVGLLLGSADFGTIARAHLMRYFRTLAAVEPVVVFLEDIHWADEQSLDLIAYLAKAIPVSPLLLIALARPSLFERRPLWGEGEAAFKRISLMPLSKRSSLALVDEILQRVEDVPDTLRDLIVDSAEGNPFYVEELVKMLIEQGVIERGAEDLRGLRQTSEVSRWTVRADKLAGLKVPPTLVGLLQARLDRLPRPERAALQRAAIVGRLFWDDAVSDLMQLDREAIGPTLESIRGRELISRRERSSFAKAEEYIFRHALLRDVAYETVLLKYRAGFHGRVARWLETHAGERLGENLSLIAEHYIQAGEHAEAAVYLERAGEEALKTGAFAPARQAFERALRLRETDGETQGPAVTAASLGLGQAYLYLSGYPAGEANLLRALTGAREAGDVRTQAQALAWLGQIAQHLGELDRAQALIDEALPPARVAGGRTLALTLARAADIDLSAGNLNAAEARATAAVAAARHVEDIALEIDALITLGNIASTRRQLDEAVRQTEAVLVLARRARNLLYEGMALLNLGDAAYRRGDFTTARAYGRESLGLLRELGQQVFVALALGNLAQADLKLGDAAAARNGAREALILSGELGSMPIMLFAVMVFAQILVEGGEVGRALTLYGLARAYPELEYASQLEIDEEVAQLGLPAAEVEAGLAAGAALDLDTVVQEILDGQW